MPLIRIDLPNGVSNDDKEKIQKKVREVVLKTLVQIDRVTTTYYSHSW